MTAWTADELQRIGTAEELQIASLRSNGTLRSPLTIWVVRLDDDLYVRSVNGRTGAWFRGAQARRAGRIWAGGIEKDVAFVEEPDAAVNARIDAAYRSKYYHYPTSVSHIISPAARLATIKLAPRPAE